MRQEFAFLNRMPDAVVFPFSARVRSGSIGLFAFHRDKSLAKIVSGRNVLPDKSSNLLESTNCRNPPVLYTLSTDT